MEQQKRNYKLLLGIFFLCIFFLLSFELVSSACIIKAIPNSDVLDYCYTAQEPRKNVERKQGGDNLVCAFKPKDDRSAEYKCLSRDQVAQEQLTFCCQAPESDITNNQFAFVTTSGLVSFARGRQGQESNFHLRCYPGKIQNDGSCQPTVPSVLSQPGRVISDTNAANEFLCRENEVVCGAKHIEVKDSVPNFQLPQFLQTIGGSFSCCTLPAGASTNLDDKNVISAGSINGVNDVNLHVCAQDRAVCGFTYNSVETDEVILDPDIPPVPPEGGYESVVENVICCKLNGVVKEESASFEITSLLKGENQVCYPNEVACGARFQQSVAGTVVQSNLFSSLACCTLRVDIDLDGVKDADDQCADTPVGERADATGCSLSQKDSDEDGVSNLDDRCPNQKGEPMEDSARNIRVCIAETRGSCIQGGHVVDQNCLDKSESDCRNLWKSDGCPSGIAETRQACDARREDGLVWLGSDQGGACCGDGDGEYFILQNEACVGSIPLQSGYSGGGFGVGRHFLSDLRSPGVKGNAEAFLTITERSQILGLGEQSPVMEDEEAPSNFIAIQKNHSHNRYLNQYSLEYAVEVDASQDTNTQLHLTLLDDQNTPVYRKTVPGTHIFPNRQRTIQDTFELSQGSEIQISVRKSGAGTVKIGSLALYHLGDRQIFFTGQDFLFCRNPEANQLLEGGRLAFERTTPQQGPLTNENNARSACAGALESGFVCDTDGQWRDKGALPHIEKSLPSEAELRDVGITLAFNRADQPNVRQTGCCLLDYCWDGGQCVPASNADSMLGLREIQANPADQEPRNLFVCALDESGSANWLPGQRKYDQYLATSSFCASEQCWFNGERQDPPSSSRCVESGEKNDQEDIFCDNGAWKTKLTALIESMLDVRDRNVPTPDQFSLYCDDLSKVVLDQEGKTAFWDRKIDTIFTGKEKACILAYNHATWRSASLAGFLLSQLFEREQRNIIIGVLLDGDDRVTDEIASKNGPQQNFCGGAKQSLATNNFVGCAGPSRTSDFARLFFNKDLNAVIFSGYADIRVRIEGGG